MLESTRLNSADLPNVGDSDTVDIEIQQLDLKSVAPINVTTCPDPQWDITVKTVAPSLG